MLSKSRTTSIPFLTKTRKLLVVMIFLSPSRKGRKDYAQQIMKNPYSIPTKTIKTLAVMQGVRPLFLSGTVVLRSKLRPAGTRKKQPSFLRLASRQGKPGKPLTPRDWIHLHRIILKAHISQIVLINLAKYPCYRIFSANAKPRRLEISDVSPSLTPRFFSLPT